MPDFQDQEAQSIEHILLFLCLMDYLHFISKVDGVIGTCVELSCRCFVYERKQLKRGPRKERIHLWGKNEELIRDKCVTLYSHGIVIIHTLFSHHGHV